MVIDLQDFEALYENSPERLSHQFTFFSTESFPTFFQRVQRIQPENAGRACILYLSEHGSDQLGKQMIPLITANEHYLASLLDPKLLSLESAKRVSEYLRKADPNFFAHLSSVAFEDKGQNSPALKTRAMAVLDELSQDDPIIPWLRHLTDHPDERVRSKAVKVLCRLRPNKSTVELHLQSSDPRVRANAIEALWHVSDPSVSLIFEKALKDSHHRVVTNALIGLHYREDARGFEMLIQLTEHSAETFRVAAAWGLGIIGDRRAIPALRRLLSDPSASVCQKAERILATFGPDYDGAALGKVEQQSSPSDSLETQQAPYSHVA